MSSRYHKKILAAIFILIALAVVKTCQAPAKPGAVLAGFDLSVTTSTPLLRQVFFDVGQGDASLIIAPDGEDILVDGGPDNKVVQKLGQYLPFDDRKIEFVILTHPHADHIDGLNEVLRRYDVGEVIMTGINYGTADYAAFLELIKSKNIPTHIIDKPQELAVGSVKLQFLEPQKPLTGQKIANLNNSSIVFRLLYVSTTALYTGDFEQEEDLASSTFDLSSDVLKVGHHGSANANSRGFLERIHPEFALISVGAGNSYGLPSYRTVHYLELLGALVFRTDISGDAVLTSDGHNYALPR